MLDISPSVQGYVQALADQAVTDGIEKYVAGAYIMHDGHLLLLQRSGTEDFLPDLIELPSGGVDPGETIIDGLVREIFEETGLVIHSVDRYINSFDYISGSGKKARQFNFTVTIVEPYKVVLNPAEHVDFFWVKPTAQDLEPHFNLSDKTRKTILEATAALLA
jgi:8-oxo-dGTP diphosphatase